MPNQRLAPRLTPPLTQPSPRHRTTSSHAPQTNSSPLLLCWNGYDHSIAWQKLLEESIVAPLYGADVPRYFTGASCITAIPVLLHSCINDSCITASLHC